MFSGQRLLIAIGSVCFIGVCPVLVNAEGDVAPRGPSESQIQAGEALNKAVHRRFLRQVLQSFREGKSGKFDHLLNISTKPLYPGPESIRIDLSAHKRESSRRPFAEYDRAGFLIFSEHTNFDSGIVKSLMAKNLPKDVTLVVMTRASKIGNSVKQEYDELVGDPSRVVAFEVPTNGAFWARDGVPVPVWYGTSNSIFDVIDAKYYHGWEQDQLIAKGFQANLVSHSYQFEGGNFMADEDGNCMIVNNSRAAQIPDVVFSEKYGCVSLLRLKHVKGIGHVDENIKIVNRNTVLTDTKEYIPVLQQAGYRVIELPRAKGSFETYANALLLNGTIFMPIYGNELDNVAEQVYASLGFKVVRTESSSLSNAGRGSIHCITMTYPPGSIDSVKAALSVQQ